MIFNNKFMNFEGSNIDKEDLELEDEYPFNIDPETGKLISDGHEYDNTPRAREFIKYGDAIRNSLPSIKKDCTRLWRGNRPGEVGQNPSFTSSLEGIAIPFWLSYGGDLSYIDVPDNDLKEYLFTGGVAENSEFGVSAELAQTAKIVEGLVNPNAREKIEKIIPKDLEDGSENPKGWDII